VTDETDETAASDARDARDEGSSQPTEETEDRVIADRGEVPPRANYLSPLRKTELERVDDVLGAVIGRFGGADAIRGAQVVDRWVEFAGEWADRSRPVAVRDGVLSIEVRTGGDATLLRFDEAAIRARIQREFGGDLVRSIRVRVARAYGG